MPRITDPRIHGTIYRLSRNPGGSTLNSGVIASWDLREQGTGDRFDYGANGYDLTNNNGATSVAGVNGTLFDGVDQSLQTDQTAAPNIWQSTASALTVALSAVVVAHTGDNNQFNPLVGIWDANADKRGWQIGKLSPNSSPANGLAFQVSSAGTSGTAASINNGGAITLGTLYHIIARYDTSNLKLQVNGTDATPVAHSAGILRDTSIDFFVARSTGSTGTVNYSNARIDNLTIWNRALSDSEVTEWYNGGSPLVIPFLG